jgi:hypothetical protein
MGHEQVYIQNYKEKHMNNTPTTGADSPTTQNGQESYQIEIETRFPKANATTLFVHACGEVDGLRRELTEARAELSKEAFASNVAILELNGELTEARAQLLAVSMCYEGAKQELAEYKRGHDYASLIEERDTLRAQLAALSQDKGRLAYALSQISFMMAGTQFDGASKTILRVLAGEDLHDIRRKGLDAALTATKEPTT